MIQSPVSHIEVKPDVCGGKPCIAGTRIRVQDVYVWHHLQGHSADEIVSRFPQLSLADVFAALTYYWDNRDEISRQMREETNFVESLKRQNISPLAQKLGTRSAANDSLPSG